MQFLTKTGIAYELHGQLKAKDLVVLVHGNGLCKTVFRKFIASVLEKSTIPLNMLSLDLGGHGNSIKGEIIQNRTKVSDFAGDILSCVDDFQSNSNIQHSRVMLVGHSIGCQISMFATIKRPHFFDSALFIEPIVSAENFGLPQAFINSTLKRKREFSNYSQAIDYYRTRGIFKIWEEDCLKDYVHGGFIQKSQNIELACTPELEAKIFSLDISEIYPLLGKLNYRSVKILVGSSSKHVIPSFLEELSMTKIENSKFSVINEADHIIMCEKQYPIVVNEFLNILQGSKL